MVDVFEFHGKLLESGFDGFYGVPDSTLKDFTACLAENAGSCQHVIAANEGSAVGMACGHYIATGKPGVVYMQNSGEGNAVNPLLSIADQKVYAIPMLLVIGWRGEPGVHDEPQHLKQGEVTCELLETMGVPFEVLDESGWEGQVDRLVEQMTPGRPVALIVRKGTFSHCGFSPDSGDAPLSRESALEVMLSKFGMDDFTVTTTGKTSREVFEIRERLGQGHGNDFLTVGGMGHTASIAFGIASGASVPVWCIDGDGSFIMHMGSLAVIAQNAPDNFRYIVNVNGAHESVGGQPNVGFEIDVAGILSACGFRSVLTARTAGEIEAALDRMNGESGSALVIYTHQGSRADLGRPTVSPRDNIDALMNHIANVSEAR